MPTWAYDEIGSEGENATAAQVQAYVNYAEGGEGNAKALSDCTSSCKSVFYMDPNLLYQMACPSAEEQQLESASSESWYVHLAGYSDKGHRAYGTYTQSCNGKSVSVPVYEMDDRDAGYQAYYRTYLQENADSWDYYFMDDTSGEVLSQLYGPGGGFCHNAPPDDYCLSTAEYPENATVAAAHGEFVNALKHKNDSPMQVFFNGVAFNEGQMSDVDVLQSSSSFVGAACEGCVVSYGLRPTVYEETLNAMNSVNATRGSFILLSMGNSSAGSSTQIEERMLTAAIFWLGYSSGHSIVWPDLENNTTNLAVWPEYNVVVTDPLESMTTGATNLQVASGVYRREFGACYDARVAIGQCAAIVNSTGSTVTISSSWLRESYTHEISVSGGDIESGGRVVTESITVNGTKLAPGQGILLAK